MTYPKPNITSPLDMFRYVDQNIAGDWLIPAFLIAFATITFVIVKKQGYKISSCSVMATTGSFIFAALFWAGGLLSGQIVVFILAMDIITFIWAKFDS